MSEQSDEFFKAWVARSVFDIAPHEWEKLPAEVQQGLADAAPFVMKLRKGQVN